MFVAGLTIYHFSGPKHMNLKLSRSKFEQIVGDLIKKTVDPCMKVSLYKRKLCFGAGPALDHDRDPGSNIQPKFVEI